MRYYERAVEEIVKQGLNLLIIVSTW